jgi:hypothetical protein
MFRPLISVDLNCNNREQEDSETEKLRRRIMMAKEEKKLGTLGRSGCGLFHSSKLTLIRSD